VATFGPSYLSFTQWALASTRPPQLRAMAIQIMAADRRHSYYPGGAFALDTALTWASGMSVQYPGLVARLRASGALRQKLEAAFRPLPRLEADVVATGREFPFYRDWLRHDRPDDPFWQRLAFSGVIPELGVPVCMVGGWYDYYLPYQLVDHARLVEA